MQTARETKQKTKRQLVEEARQAALEGRWEEAIAINQELLERFPRDAETHNRLGRAYIEFGRYPEAIEAYHAALRIDPANMIARRNLQRLDLLRHRPAPAAAEEGNGRRGSLIPRTTVFIEEVGKTWVDELVNPAPMEELVEIPAGEPLQLVAEGERLFVHSRDGRRLGEVEPKTARRIIELQAGGNRYEVYALGLSGQSIRVIVREVYRDPSQARTVSFPGRIKTARAYLRERDLLRQRDEADFLLSDEDEEEDEEEETPPEPGEELDTAEPEPEPFLEGAVTVEEEEQPI